ncbi:MerC family mercury resistance protein, partial [Roseisolibacter sp. H3M3-2]|uniref:MerC family mercury resistance protein n=1 Tax=Roseisolibacter sp. H3M3-2 TaxID=3031323 RepID=UPI0023DB2060
MPASPTPPPASRGRLDVVGAAVACACACHCVAIPLVVALAPALGLGVLLDERVEGALFATTLVVGAASLGPAARRAAADGWWRAPALFAA